MTKRETVERATRALVDKGLVIEAGFVGLRMLAMAPDAPPIQVREMRMAFFAGAQHLFSSIMTMLDEDREPTEADIKRMDQIEAELRRFIEEFEARHLTTKGTA